MRHIALILPVAVLATACASASDPGALPQRRTHTVPVSSGQGNTGTGVLTTYDDAGPATSRIAATADVVYGMLPDAIGSAGLTVGTLDPATRTAGNRRIEISRRLGGVPLSNYLRCGETAFGAPTADSYRIQLSVLSTVVPRDAESELRTAVEATATPVGQGTAQPCTSTGVLEQAIAKAVLQRLAQRE